jgi:sodium/bile acid cotransporter 7
MDINSIDNNSPICNLIPMKNRLIQLIKKQWFMILLAAIFILNIGDPAGTIPAAGTFLREKLGAHAPIFLIFVCSGLLLDLDRIRDGVKDYRGIILSLLIIFVVAPAVAYIFGRFPLNREIIIGIFLVAAMPTTLSSGVVMTGAAGGNIAHALMITVTASSLAVFTVPFTLSLMLGGKGAPLNIDIDKGALMLKIFIVVIVPLFVGLSIKHFTGTRAHNFFNRKSRMINTINLCLVGVIVWMGVAATRTTILENSASLWTVLIVVTLFHLLMIAVTFAAVGFFSLGRGRGESVIFMSIQKTLALSIAVQITVFPEFGLALVVCVMHHMVHLIIDSYIAGRMASKS